MWIRSLRRQLYRSPVRWWISVTVCTVILVYIVSDIVADAKHTKAQFGDLATAYRATTDLDPGQRLTSEDFERVELPRTFLPNQAINKAVPGVQASRRIAAHSILTALDLDENERSQLARSLGERQAVAIPRETPQPPTILGDRVNVYAIDPNTGTAKRVVSSAEVLESGDERTLIGVSNAEAAPLATALMAGPIVISVTGGL